MAKGIQTGERLVTSIVSARSVALECLKAVAEDDAYANLVMPKLLRNARLDSRDAALAQELAFGTIRWQLFYDEVIEVCANRSVKAIDLGPKLILRLGVHQLLNTRIPAHAALSETVELAKHQLSAGAVGFINGVLRRVSERSLEQWFARIEASKKTLPAKLAIRHSHPEWIVSALEQSLRLDDREGDLESLLACDNEAPKVNLAALPGFSTPAELLGSEISLGAASPIGLVLDAGNPAAVPQVAKGFARVQDEGSQLIPLALVAASEVRPGEQWLDLCAGPGGKAALLASLAKIHRSNLTCNEIAPHRARLVEQALTPLELDIYVRTGDGRDLGEDAPEAFDRILVDAPCTGLGALRRRPEARWRRKPSDLSDLTKLQKELLLSAWKGLAPGGVLAYSTCSPHVSETIAIVDWALKQFGTRASLINANEVLRRVNPQLDLSENRSTAQLWPHLHHTDAMFLALITKQ